ncbi:MAG: macro domain-containing protein [Lachnospiraceae bacterium]|nr:macro domain-containing protein [Lachnospiraceae bacterium]
MAFRIIRNDITKVKADAIVNTANPDVIVGDGVDRAIYEAAGEEKLLEARAKIGILNPGELAITKAFKLNAKYIIHVSGPVYIDGNANEADKLRLCYDRALNLAFDNNCKSIAFPLLATGTYGFPKDLGIKIAVDAFTEFLEEHEMEIILVVFGDETVRISGELGEEVSSYIDANYENRALKSEYRHDNLTGVSARAFGVNSFVRRRSTESFAASEMVDITEESFDASEEYDSVAKEMSLDDALKDIYTDSFEKHLQQLINKKGLKNSQVYSAANISKQYFSKLLKGKIKPSKEKMLALSVGLKLNLDETYDFLRIAGYTLSPISQTDVVVKYFIEHENYNVLKIDIVLFDYGLDPLSTY